MDPWRQKPSHRFGRLVRHRFPNSVRWVRSPTSLLKPCLSLRADSCIDTEHTLTDVIQIYFFSITSYRPFPALPTIFLAFRGPSHHSQRLASQKQIDSDHELIDAALLYKPQVPASPTSLRSIVSLVSDSYLGKWNSMSFLLAMHISLMLLLFSS